MNDIFQNAKVETSMDTRNRVARALGFDEPPVEQKLSRSSFCSDEEYFDACARLAVQNYSPEYRAEYTRIRREYNARKAEEEAAAAEKKHQQEIAQAITNCVLRPEEQKRVDDEARSRAQADLAAGRISFQQLGETVAQYAERLTQEEKESKVHNADINRQIREALLQARGLNLAQ